MKRYIRKYPKLHVMLGEGEEVQMTFEIRPDSPDPVCSQKRKLFAINRKSP